MGYSYMVSSVWTVRIQYKQYPHVSTKVCTVSSILQEKEILGDWKKHSTMLLTTSPLASLLLMSIPVQYVTR